MEEAAHHSKDGGDIRAMLKIVSSSSNEAARIEAARQVVISGIYPDNLPYRSLTHHGLIGSSCHCGTTDGQLPDGNKCAICSSIPRAPPTGITDISTVLTSASSKTSKTTKKVVIMH